MFGLMYKLKDHNSQKDVSARAYLSMGVTYLENV